MKNLSLNARIVGALIVFIAAIILQFNSANVFADVPPGAKLYGPALVKVQTTLWADAQEPWTLAGLIEQESCVSLRHSKCWNPHAELKTSREYGFGFGQTTVAYRENGTVLFNKFDELRQAYPTLRNWTWDDRYNVDMQLTAVVEMVHALFDRVKGAETINAHWAFTLSSYNGGAAGVLQDRRLCSNTTGCNPGLWFGNVENTSLKSKVPQPAYGGQSWFSINRQHVRNVMTIRRDKYQTFWSL